METIERQSTEIKITVPWGHVGAKTYGSSKGKSVLMVHGRLDNAGSFTRLMKYLPIDNYYYVCIDLPGHGRSSPFPSWQMINILNYAYVLHFILEALQWKTCIYIGHSMGVQLAILFTTLQPHRIKKIIAIDGFVPEFIKEDGFITNFKEMFELSIKSITNSIELPFYTKEKVLYTLQHMRYAYLNSDAANALFERGVIEVNGKYRYTTDIRLKIQCFSLMSLNQVLEIAREISIPICLILPTNGWLNNDYDMYKIIQSMNPKNRFEVNYVDGNHDCHNNNPERVAPIIYKFLNNDNSSKL